MTEHIDDAESLKEDTITHSEVSRLLLSDREMEFKEVINEMKRRRNNLGKTDKYKNEKGGQG